MNQYDHFKDKLHDYQVKTDKEKIWRNTAHAIPQRRKRRVILLFLFGVLIGTAWLGYTLSIPGTGSSHMAKDSLRQPVAVQERIVENHADASTTTIIKGAVQINGSKPQKTKPSIQSNSSAQTSIKNAGSEKNVAGIVEVSAFDAQAVTNDRSESNQVPLISTLPSSTEDGLVINHEYTSPGPTIAIDYVRSFAESTDPLPSLAVPFPDELNSIGLSSTAIPVIPSDSKRKRVSISVMAAIGISSLDIRALNHEAKETAALLNRSVRSLEHLSVDVAASLPLPHDMAVATKLGWNQWTTETKQQTTSYQPFTQEGVTTIVIDEDGARHPVSGSVNGVRIIHKDLARFTQYQSITADVALHKVLWRKHRMSVGGYAEGSFVINDQASGSAYDTEWELRRFSKQENPFVRKSLFGFGGGVNMNYQVSRLVRISGTLSYQPVKYQWQHEQQQIEWTHSVLRGNFGVSYRIQ